MMEYRTLGRTGAEAGVIGLGTEYLLDLDPATMGSIVHAAIDAGVNYIDVLYDMPHWLDDMAVAFAGMRERAYLAIHWGSGEENGQPAAVWAPAASERFFREALTHLRTDRADVLLFHMVDQMSTYEGSFLPALERARRYQEQGAARWIGMSSHKAPVALRAVQSGLIDVLMYPVNLASATVAGNRELFAACAEHNVALVAMKPYAGGQLLRAEPSTFVHWVQAGGQSLQLANPNPITPVQCLSYTLAQPGVCTAVPGVKSVAELESALGYLTAPAVERDHAALAMDIQHYAVGQCQYCNHCLPCPAQIDVAQVLRLLDRAQVELTPELRAAYAALPARGADCTGCEDCLQRCPFEVNVPQRMREAAALFA
jgi:uncharacterized protein